MSYNGYFYSPYYQQQQQQQQQPSSHAPTSYSQQTSSSTSQYQTNQLPSIGSSHAQTTPVSGSYETSTYPSSYDSYSRTETRSDQSQRGGSRHDYSNYTATSRADDGSGYGSSSYASRPLMGQSSRDSHGSNGNGNSTSFSRSDYQSQKPDDRTITSSYQYPSTYASTTIAHAAPYTQAPQTSQSSRRQSVRSPLMYSASYDTSHGQGQASAPPPEENARSYQLPSISKASNSVPQEHRRSGSDVYSQRSNQPSPRPTNLPSYVSSSTSQIPEPVPTPEPRTQTPQQVYREERNNPRDTAIIPLDEDLSISTENRGAQKSHAKKHRPAQPRAARNKDVAHSKSTSKNASNATTASQQSPVNHVRRPETEIQEQPATVDPSRVFNQYEYQRRKDAIEAESRAAKEAAEKASEDARKAKEEAAQKAKDEAEARTAAKAKEDEEAAQKRLREEEEVRKRHAKVEDEARKKRARADEEGRRKQVPASSSADTTALPQPRTQLPAQTVESSASLTSPALAKDPSNADAIKALFGSMFGQMRELKAKDPTLFSEVWEDFKKVIAIYHFSNRFTDTRRRVNPLLAEHLRKSLRCKVLIKPLRQ